MTSAMDESKQVYHTLTIHPSPIKYVEKLPSWCPCSKEYPVNNVAYKDGNCPPCKIVCLSWMIIRIAVLSLGPCTIGHARVNQGRNPQWKKYDAAKDGTALMAVGSTGCRMGRFCYGPSISISVSAWKCGCSWMGPASLPRCHLEIIHSSIEFPMTDFPSRWNFPLGYCAHLGQLVCIAWWSRRWNVWFIISWGLVTSWQKRGWSWSRGRGGGGIRCAIIGTMHIIVGAMVWCRSTWWTWLLWGVVHRFIVLLPAFLIIS